MASDASVPNDAMWFLYTGADGEAVPMDVTHLRVHPAVSVIPANAFEGCRQLQRVMLPAGLLRIGERAFYYCERLENVDFPDGLLEIGESAFYGCSSLLRMKIPSTVTVIHEYTFSDCEQLVEAVLPEGVIEIGRSAFSCCRSLERINFPSTLKIIARYSFFWTALSSVDLPDEVENIGEKIFWCCGALNNVRIPPLVREIGEKAFYFCGSMFSLELPEGVNRVCYNAFQDCYSLRNISISPGAEMESDEFDCCKDLLQLFDSSIQIEEALMHRFDGLPIHKLLYYHSYHSTEDTLEHLNKVANLRNCQTRSLRSKLNPTGNQRDCLGMTPLHVLSCSKKQSIELYRVMIEKYPTNLVTEDKWGGLPLFYALWGRAPGDIIQFLINGHKSNFPDHELNWEKMVETMSMACAPLDVLETLLNTQQTSFPDQKIDWGVLVDNSAKPITGSDSDRRFSVEMFRFLIRCSISDRLSSIGLKQWRTGVIRMIQNIPEETDDYNQHTNTRKGHLDRIRSELAAYERDFRMLKEATTMLELALWSAKMNESKPMNPSSGGERHQKKMKIDEPRFRQQCRVSCGADTVIENVLPYVLPTKG